MQLVEELHLARSEKRLELNVVEIYGELTSMDIDPSEEGITFTLGERTTTNNPSTHTSQTITQRHYAVTQVF